MTTGQIVIYNLDIRSSLSSVSPKRFLGTVRRRQTERFRLPNPDGAQSTFRRQLVPRRRHFGVGKVGGRRKQRQVLRSRNLYCERKRKRIREGHLLIFFVAISNSIRGFVHPWIHGSVRRSVGQTFFQKPRIQVNQDKFE